MISEINMSTLCSLSALCMRVKVYMKSHQVVLVFNAIKFRLRSRVITTDDGFTFLR